MSLVRKEIHEVPEIHFNYSTKSKDHPHWNVGHILEGGFPIGSTCYSEIEDQLVQMVVELVFQNEYLKLQFEELKDLNVGVDYISQEGGLSEDVKFLHEKMESQIRELSEERQTRIAAEDALKHLRAAHSEADAKAQELSVKLDEAQLRMGAEIKERDERYSELDSKFSRVLKRAKQRIQEVQKEKDDLEAQFQAVNETAEQTLSQKAQLQQELDRLQLQASEALKAIDADRQLLRSANNKLRNNVEELKHSLEPKDSALQTLRQSITERDMMLEDMQKLLQATEEKSQASITELSAKHLKNIENLEAQIADVLSDRTNATKTVSSLQVLLAEKESKIAEMNAASSMEAAQLKDAVETSKKALDHLKSSHEKEKEGWEAASQTLNAKLEAATSNCVRAEIEAAKMRSQLEFDLSFQTQLLNTRDAELMAAKEEITHLKSEFSSYKLRAHALLQKKDADLAAAKDSKQLKILEEALKEAEKEILLTSTDKDNALHELQAVLASHDKELEARDAALSWAEQQIKHMGLKLESANERFLLDKEELRIKLQNSEESWRLRFEELKAEKQASPGLEVQRELEDLKLLYKRLKEEHDSFRDLADRTIIEKDKEISRHLDDIKGLRQSLELKPMADWSNDSNTASPKQGASAPSVAEQQILIFARQQANREEELTRSQRHIIVLQEEIEELEHENRLHNQQEAMLKGEIRNMERMQRREGVDMTYLKNVILKLLQTGEVEALLPVVGTLLQFSPEEMQKCHQHQA